MESPTVLPLLRHQIFLNKYLFIFTHLEFYRTLLCKKNVSSFNLSGDLLCKALFRSFHRFSMRLWWALTGPFQNFPDFTFLKPCFGWFWYVRWVIVILECEMFSFCPLKFLKGQKVLCWNILLFGALPFPFYLDKCP